MTLEKQYWLVILSTSVFKH